MKQITQKLFRAPTALLLALGLTGSQALADIVGSVHDFSNSGFSGGEICVVCHTTHHADTSVTEAPLWNHELTSQTFAMYSSPTLDAAQDAQPTGASKLCLSCHDGATALDAYGGSAGSIFLTGPAAVGANDDLTDDHPISITYDSALAVTDPGLHDPTQQTVTIGSGNKSRTGLISELMTPAGKLQCSSCHDVHNTFVAGNNRFLLMLPKSGSQICLACHDK